MNEETNTKEITTEGAREIKIDISPIMGHGTKGEDVKMAMTFVPLSNFRRPQVRSMSCGCQRIYVQLIGFLIFVLLIAVIRMISNMRVVFVQYHMASDTDGELVLLPVEFAASRGAFCLDGSPPGYYIRYGKYAVPLYKIFIDFIHGNILQTAIYRTYMTCTFIRFDLCAFFLFNL